MAISASIQALISGDKVASSKLSKKLLDELMVEGLLLVTTRGSRKSYRARDIEALKRYLIDIDESYRMLDVAAADSRASMAAETGNSKLMMIRSCPGFPINSYDLIECRLDDKPFPVCPREGSFLFVTDWKHFTIPHDVTVMGIENMENFRQIRHQRRFFEDYLHSQGLPDKVLFVSRYPQSPDLRHWLSTIHNHYLHFGDFDLAGIHIFLSEFHKHLGDRSSFLIPDDIELRIAKGSAVRYDEQYDKFHSLHTDVTYIQSLIDIINKYHRNYDQEGYIE